MDKHVKPVLTSLAKKIPVPMLDVAVEAAEKIADQKHEENQDQRIENLEKQQGEVLVVSGIVFYLRYEIDLNKEVFRSLEEQLNKDFKEEVNFSSSEIQIDDIVLEKNAVNVNLGDTTTKEYALEEMSEVVELLNTYLEQHDNEILRFDFY